LIDIGSLYFYKIRNKGEQHPINCITLKKLKKMASYRKVEFEMARGNGYGQYLIIGTYGGKDITVHTTNSEAFDWINDDSNPAMNKSARS